MTIANTDKFLVNRSGSSYHVEAQSFDDVQPTDILLVNRAGKSYKCTRANLDAKLLDDDILLINRGNQSYKVTGAEFKTLLTVLPEIASVTLTELTPNKTRWTDQQFRWDCVMAEDGDPASTRRITYYIEGKFAQRLRTDTITGWDAGSKTLTFASDKDIAPMDVGDVVRQDETSIIGSWGSFDADGSNTYNGGNNSAITSDDTNTYIFVGQGTNPFTTWCQRGPITNEGPWTEVQIDNFTSRSARIVDDALCCFGVSSVNGSATLAIAYSEDGGKTFQVSNPDVEGAANLSVNDFVFWNSKYWIASTQGLYVSDSLNGTFTRVTEVDAKCQQLAITPWGLYLANMGRVSSSANSVYQYKINNDLTVTQFLNPNSRTTAFGTCAYRNGVLAFIGFYTPASSSSNVLYMWSSDGENFEIYEAVGVKKGGGIGGIKYDGNFVHQDDSYNLKEFNPTTKTSIDPGITTSRMFKGTYDGGVLTFATGRFTELWQEGTIAPVGIVGSVDAAANEITLSSTTGDWSANSGNYGIGNVKYLTAKRHLKFSGNDVVDFWPDGWDPALITTDLTRTITFPSVFPSGRTPDDEIAPGSTIICLC